MNGTRYEAEELDGCIAVQRDEGLLVLLHVAEFWTDYLYWSICSIIANLEIRVLMLGRIEQLWCLICEYDGSLLWSKDNEYNL